MAIPSQFPPASQSALSSHLKSSTTITISSQPSPLSHPAHLHHLAAQITHNLRYQHDWTDLHTVTHSPRSPSRLLPRPLIVGLPPQRIYIHPDEQMEILQRQKKKKKKDGARENRDDDDNEEEEDDDERPERVWVLPTHLREKWSLKRFAEVFDHITRVPPALDGDGHVVLDGGEGKAGEGDDGSGRRVKRVLLATLSDDSTVVYYIVHDGIVKPRQN